MDILLEGQSMHPGLIERFATRGIREALLVSDELERRGAISASIEVLEWANQAYPDNETIETRFVESCLLVKTCAPKLDDFSVKLLARSTEEGDPDRRIRARRLGYMVQAQLLNRDGQDRQARVLYEEVANLLPAEGFLPLSRAAWILIRTGQLQTAKARIQRLEDMAITDKDQVELLRIKSAVTKAEGDLQGAVNALQQAIRIQRNTPDLYLELAALFDMRGERRAAKSARELAERLRTR
jgi:tetratricopeptide (TPR) repeat protein